MKDKWKEFYKKHKNKIWFFGMVILVAVMIFSNQSKEKIKVKEQSITIFINEIKKDKIKDFKEVKVMEDESLITYTYKKVKYKVHYPRQFLTENPEILNEFAKHKVKVEFTKSTTNTILRIGEIFRILIFVFLFYIIFKMVADSFGGFDIKEVEEEKLSFDDIAGSEGVKKEFADIINYFKDPKKYKKYIEKAPNILLEGPPGVGKTYFARALASMLNIPYFQISGSDIEDKYVGSGARRVEKLFKVVRKRAEEKGGALLFIDELDAFAGKRTKRTVQETNQTINKFLTEVDGFSKDTKVIIIAATNLVSELDEAVVRSGRFDRIIHIPKPNLKDREAVVKLYLDKKGDLVHPEVYEENYAYVIAQQTEGFSNADLAKLVNTEASLLALNKNTKIDIKTLREAFTKIIAGIETNQPVTERDKKIIAYHEAGHATAQIMTSKVGYKGVAYITITPHGQSLGHVSPVSDESPLNLRSEMENKVKVLLAGRAVEEKILKGDYSSGAANDLQQASRVLIYYVAKYGMSKLVENLFIEHIDENSEMVQNHVKLVRDKLYLDTKELIEKHYDIVEKIAEHLLLHTSIEQHELPILLKGTSYENVFVLEIKEEN